MVTVLSFVMDACFHESEAGLDVDVEWGECSPWSSDIPWEGLRRHTPSRRALIFPSGSH